MAVSPLGLCQWWEDHRVMLLRTAIVFMSLLAIYRMGHEFNLLLFSNDGAEDLASRYREVQQWFLGTPVYQEYGEAVYPPASYAMLWPLLKPFSWVEARFLWGLLLTASTAWLIYQAVKYSNLKASLERVAMALFIIAMYPTATTFGTGQLTSLVIPLLVAGVVLIRNEQTGWRQDLYVSLLLVFSLVKPSIAIPFFWTLLISQNFLRVLALAAVEYGGLTFWAASYQRESVLSLFHQWVQRASANSFNHGPVNTPSNVLDYIDFGSLEKFQSTGIQIWQHHASVGFGVAGYGNITSMLSAMGLGSWAMPASLCILIVAGVWIYYHRHADIWLLLGVTAIVSRFWAYHRLYDDLLILLPFITMLRVAQLKTASRQRECIAGILAVCCGLALLAPATLLKMPFPIGLVFRGAQVLLWAGMLAFLLNQARLSQKQGI